METYNFGPNVIYFAMGITEGRPVGAFWVEQVFLITPQDIEILKVFFSLFHKSFSASIIELPDIPLNFLVFREIGSLVFCFLVFRWAGSFAETLSLFDMQCFHLGAQAVDGAHSVGLVQIQQGTRRNQKTQKFHRARLYA